MATCCDLPCYATPVYADLTYKNIIQSSGADFWGFADCACGDPMCTDSCEAALLLAEQNQRICREVAVLAGKDPALACPSSFLTNCGAPRPAFKSYCQAGEIRFDLAFEQFGFTPTGGFGAGFCAPFPFCCDGTTPVTNLLSALACPSCGPKPTCKPPGRIQLVNGIPVCMFDPPLPIFPMFEALSINRTSSPRSVHHAISRSSGTSSVLKGLNPTLRVPPTPFIFAPCNCGLPEDYEEALA